jgi:glutamate racemase
MIGVYDSGSGGLSVLREILKILPREKYVYYADNAYCPYGEKTPEFIIERGRAITEYLLGQGADIIVVACNTATGAAISTLRREYPALPFIGMEPAVKPAALSSRTGVIGVLATAGTLRASKYLNTKGIYEGEVKIVENVGKGFVELVEKGILDGPEAEEIVSASLQPLLDAGADRIVLGCTHYPFLIAPISRLAGPSVEIIDPAPAVARQLRNVMEARGLLRGDAGPELPDVALTASGDDTSERRLYKLILQDINNKT